MRRPWAADVATAVAVPPAPVTSATATSEAVVASEASRPDAPRPSGRRKPRPLATVAIAAAVVACLLGAGLLRAEGKLRSAQGSLDATSSQLDATSSHVVDLEASLHDANAATQQARSEADKAQAGEKDARTALDACREVFRITAKYPNPNAMPPDVQREAGQEFLTCFGGHLPTGLYG
jgi:hypothetical protein